VISDGRLGRHDGHIHNGKGIGKYDRGCSQGNAGAAGRDAEIWSQGNRVARFTGLDAGKGQVRKHQVVGQAAARHTVKCRVATLRTVTDQAVVRAIRVVRREHTAATYACVVCT
jgi:hypothetical protein